MKWDQRLTELKVSVNKSEVDYTKQHWRVVAAWITLNGNWETAPQWAREFQQDTLGGDHHIYCMALFKDGSVAKEAGFRFFWPGGEAGRLPEPDGWANIPITASYNPLQRPGPYSAQKYGNAEVVEGMGLPFPLPWPAAQGGHHVSFFIVWQQCDPQAPEMPGRKFSGTLRLGPLRIPFAGEVEWTEG